MKKPEELKPNFGPAYAAAMYPDLAKIFISNGYALAVHGSLARDLDLVAVPWESELTEPLKVIQEVCNQFAVRLVGDGEKRNHGRVAYTLSVMFGECSIDLSFLPNRLPDCPPEPLNALDKVCEAAKSHALEERAAEIVKRCETAGWTDVYGGPEVGGMYWRGTSPETGRVEEIPKSVFQ